MSGQESDVSHRLDISSGAFGYLGNTNRHECTGSWGISSVI